MLTEPETSRKRPEPRISEMFRSEMGDEPRATMDAVKSAADPPAKGPKVLRHRKIGMYIRAIVIMGCAALSLNEVRLLIEEYLSFPIVTHYMMDDADWVPAPAFTVCPQPAVRSNFKWDSAANRTEFEDFKNATVSLTDFLLHAPFGPPDCNYSFNVHGETVFHLPNEEGEWIERTYFKERKQASSYFKCFTLLSKKDFETQPFNCSGGTFVFDFKDLGGSRDPKIRVFVHDRREKFALPLSGPEKLNIYNNTVTSIFIRPQIIEKLSKKDVLCSANESHSYTRCRENCFWEKVQNRSGLPCLTPILLTKEAELKKSVCKDRHEEQLMIGELLRALGDWAPNTSRSCDCPRRCNVTEYRISGDPTSACVREAALQRGDGRAVLFVTFPSKQVPHFLEKERVTLPDLLSNIGGIVGVCLGISLITVYDLMKKVFLRIHWKFPGRDRVVCA